MFIIRALNTQAVPRPPLLLGARLEDDFAKTGEQAPGPLPEAARKAAQEVEQAARDEDAADAPAVCGDGEHERGEPPLLPQRDASVLPVGVGDGEAQA